MYKLSKDSKRKLETCDPRLISIIESAIAISPIDFTVIEGHRSVARQRQLFEIGATKIDGITRLGKHNHEPSLAVDVAPYPIDWQDLRRFYYLAGCIMSVAASQGIGLRWGGDWNSNGSFDDQTFHDLPHFELTGEDDGFHG